MQPATSDDFTNSTMGLQWQWNHNPDNTRWSLTERPGWLRLHPTMATNIWVARNTLTQKGQGPQSSGIVKLDLSNLQAGDVAGFGVFGKVCAGTGVQTLTMHKLHLRLVNNRNVVSFSYGVDGQNWTPFPQGVEVSGYHHNVAGDFLSLRPAIFAAGNGEVRFKNFKYQALP